MICAFSTWFSIFVVIGAFLKLGLYRRNNLLATIGFSLVQSIWRFQSAEWEPRRQFSPATVHSFGLRCMPRYR